MEVSEGKERILKDIMAKNFPDVRKDMTINVQEAQQDPSKMNSKRPTLRHIIVKHQKRQRILKAAREKQFITYNGSSIIIRRFVIRNFRDQREVS